MFELEMPLRGQQARVLLIDIQLPSLNEIELAYRVFLIDPEDEMEYELTQTTKQEQAQIYAAIIRDLHELCS